MKKVEPINGRYMWVEYECGCQEGVAIHQTSRCRIHNKIIIKASNTTGLGMPDDAVKI